MRSLLVGLLLLGAGCSTQASASPQVITVRIEHSRFVPSELDVRAGTTVRFVVVNTDPIDHEFLIGDRASQRAHELGTEAHHGAKAGEISVPAGTRRSTTFTFEGPGELLLGCHLPQHYSYGMKGLIRIR